MRLVLPTLALVALNVVQAQPSAPPAAIIPQVADGGGWRTCIHFYNPNPYGIGAQYAFYGDDGKLTEFWLDAETRSKTAATTLCAGCSALTCTGGLGYETKQGYAKIFTWAQPSGSGMPDTSKPVPVSCFGVFTFLNAATGHAQEGTAPGDLRSDKPLAIPFNNYMLDTGIAVLNSSSVGMNVQVTVRDYAAKVLGQAVWTFQPGEKKAFNLIDAFPQTARKYGVIQFQAIYGTNSSLVGFGLRFNSSGAFTTLFPVN